MRTDRRDALLDFLLMAVADEGTTPFATDVLAGSQLPNREWLGRVLAISDFQERVVTDSTSLDPSAARRHLPHQWNC